jgi:hypothetical protein
MNSKSSKEVLGVAINIGSNDRITIKISRETKAVSRDELSTLSTEYKLDELTLLQLFIKRKIEVIYDDSDPRQQLEAQYKTKKNARNKKARKQDPSLNQLLESISDSRLSQEIPIPATNGVQE